MKLREVMTQEPVCCVPSDTAQKVAALLRDQDIGSMPVVSDQDSRRLVGMITDRDLCCTVVAEGLDPRSERIERHMTREVIACHVNDSLDDCEKKMQQHQVRRLPIVDDTGRCVGVVAQADIALKEKASKVAETLEEISQPTHHEPGKVA